VKCGAAIASTPLNTLYVYWKWYSYLFAGSTDNRVASDIRKGHDRVPSVSSIHRNNVGHDHLRGNVISISLRKIVSCAATHRIPSCI